MGFGADSRDRECGYLCEDYGVVVGGGAAEAGCGEGEG